MPKVFCWIGSGQILIKLFGKIYTLISKKPIHLDWNYADLFIIDAKMFCMNGYTSVLFNHFAIIYTNICIEPQYLERGNANTIVICAKMVLGQFY